MRQERQSSDAAGASTGTVTRPTSTQCVARIPRGRLVAYFDQVTKRFFRDDSPEAVHVEIVGRQLGDQDVIRGLHLLGITYDPRSAALEFSVEVDGRDVGDHRIYAPQEVWVVEEQNGFPAAVEVVRSDGTREIVTIRPADTSRAADVSRRADVIGAGNRASNAEG